VFVGDTNSANPLFRAGAEPSEGAALRVTHEAARQLGLADGQIVKGVVDRESGTVRLTTDTGALTLAYQQSAYNPTVIWFRAVQSAYGLILRPLPPKPVSQSASQPASGQEQVHDDSTATVRRLLLTLLNRPSLSTMWSALNPEQTSSNEGLALVQEEYRKLAGGLPRAQDLDIETIRSALAGLSAGISGVMAPSLLRSLWLALLSRRPGDNSSSGQHLEEALKFVQEYLESARVESLLQQEQGRLLARFPLFFADAPPVEVSIAGHGKSRYAGGEGWQLDLEMQLSGKDRLWLNCLFSQDWEVRATAWTTDTQLALRMQQGRPELASNLASFGLQLGSLQVIEGPRPEMPALSLLSSTASDTAGQEQQ